MAVTIELAPAKVNLTLAVRGRRPDGYHEIISLVAFARDIADRVTVRPGGTAVLCTGPFAGGIEGENLVSRALALVSERHPPFNCRDIHVEKCIPVAAGLGGGSADAAAFLRAASRVCAINGVNLELDALAPLLGADVPVCLLRSAALMSGRGETVRAVALSPLFATLVNPMIEVPTNKTAAVFDRLGARELCPADADLSDCVPDRPAELLPFILDGRNDLEAPCRALMPAVVPVLDALLSMEHCLAARLSGAGPTCFGLFHTLAAATAAAALLSAEHPKWWVRATRLQ